MNFDNRADIHGISAMIRTEEIDSNADLDELEKKILNGKLFINEKPQTSTSQKHNMGLDNIIENNYINNFNENIREDVEPTAKSMFGMDIKEEDNKSYYSEDEVRSEYKSQDKNYSSDNKFFKHNTKEEKRAKALKQFLQGDDDDDDNNNDDKYNIGHERLEDDKIVMIEQIENLKVELEIEGCDVTKFEVNENDNHEKIQDIWRKLKLKSQYKTYSNMFEEGILLGAEFIEWAFDGDKEYFGYKPCMIGWSDTVKVKLKRMRLETASFVSGIMQEYKMSAGLSIMTQLAISGVLYSVTKRKDDEYTNEPSRHATNKEWKDAVIDFDD